MQTLYNCGPNKVPLPGELRAVEIVQRIKVGRQCEVAGVVALWPAFAVLAQQAALGAAKRVTPLLCAADTQSGILPCMQHTSCPCGLPADGVCVVCLLCCAASCACVLQELSEKLIVVVGSDELSKEAQRNATTTFMTNLRATLASKRVLGEYM